MKKLIATALTIIVAIAAHAEGISLVSARNIAQQFINGNPKLKLTASAQASLQLAHRAVATDGTVDFYAFNRGTNSGYIIVGGDDKALPVWGYSTSGHFDADNLPQNMQWWLQQYRQQLQWLRSHPDTQPAKAAQLSTSVAPLLTTQWNQGYPYCSMCPITEIDGYYYYTFTGCVATATAQIMKYHNWPPTGAGHHSYDCHVNDSDEPTTLAVDYSQSTYNWDQMLDTYTYNNYTDEQGMAVAKLMSDVGIAVDMQYSPYGSGAYSHRVAGALIAHFGYDASMQYLMRDDYTGDWDAMLRDELDARRPIYYSGTGSGGHAFVFDGYDTNGYFHINWGWGGASDGYFSSTVLNPNDQGAGSSSGGYSNNQTAIIGIKPAAAGTGAIAIIQDVTPLADVMPADDVRGTIVAEATAGNFNGQLAMWVITDSYDALDYVEVPVNIAAGKQKKITFKASIDAADGETYYLALRNPYIDTYAYIWNNVVPFTVGSWQISPTDTGDVNTDGTVDIDDVNAVIGIILGKFNQSDFQGEADVDGNSNIDIDDVNAIIAIITSN